LTTSKRPERFLELVRCLRQDGHVFRAQVIGDGPLLAQLKARAAAVGVELLGRRDDVPQLLRNSDVMAFTSVPESEGMPGVYIEAGLSGVPVVTTEVPGARSVIMDGRSGYVVGIDDMASLVNRTADLLTNAELRSQMGAMARTYCERELSLQRSVDRWRQLLRELLPHTSKSHYNEQVGS
jgi:glycosyltransferase involved in cell wall biosynthesis